VREKVMTRMVHCVKLGRELPGLPYPPIKGKLGERIYQTVSEPAWDMWLKHSTMFINEYRINPTEKEARQALREELEKFFFGEGAEPPPDYAPADG
jgi:Fe-S cluster biosynthesis and repair protein YggX